ncbi:hypothetical protein [Helicobacter pylori]|nr:hypothetical protein [Helicobacter pylori]
MTEQQLNTVFGYKNQFPKDNSPESLNDLHNTILVEKKDLLTNKP